LEEKIAAPVWETANTALWMTTWHPLAVKDGVNFADKRRPLGRYSSLSDSGHGVLGFFSLSEYIYLLSEDGVCSRKLYGVQQKENS
jgi:hypothetical protein